MVTTPNSRPSGLTGMYRTSSGTYATNPKKSGASKSLSGRSGPKESSKNTKLNRSDRVNQENLSNLQKMFAGGEGKDPLQDLFGLMDVHAKAEKVRQTGKFKENIMAQNIGSLNQAALDAIRRGEISSKQHLDRFNKLQGSQRVAFAAQGIEIDGADETSGQILEETRELGMEDAAIIRSNAYQEAFGYKQKAADMEVQMNLSRKQRKIATRSGKIIGTANTIKNIADTVAESTGGGTGGGGNASGIASAFSKGGGK